MTVDAPFFLLSYECAPCQCFAFGNIKEMIESGLTLNFQFPSTSKRCRSVSGPLYSEFYSEAFFSMSHRSLFLYSSALRFHWDGIRLFHILRNFGTLEQTAMKYIVYETCIINLSLSSAKRFFMSLYLPDF